jgi:OHCU decarboxylase
MSLAEINILDKEKFVATLGGLFEASPWIAAVTWRARPFKDANALHQALCGVMFGATLEQKVTLIRAHPDLVGKAALAGTLMPESAGEQASAGLHKLTPGEINNFKRLNTEYREKFGFPFVICVRENKKESILAGFSARIRNTREQEIDTALTEIAKIAYLRLIDILGND